MVFVVECVTGAYPLDAVLEWFAAESLSQAVASECFVLLMSH